VVCLCSKPALINEQRGYYKTERVEDLQFNQLHLLQWHDTFENALQRGSIVEKNYCFWKNKVSKQNRDRIWSYLDTSNELSEHNRAQK